MVSLSRWRDCVWPTSSTSTCCLREISAVLRVLRSARPVAIVSEQVCAYSVIAPCCLTLSPSRETWGFPPRSPLLTAHTFTSLRKGAQVSGSSQESLCTLAAEVPWGWRWRPPFTDFQRWARFPDLYSPSVVLSKPGWRMWEGAILTTSEVSFTFLTGSFAFILRKSCSGSYCRCGSVFRSL